MNNFNFGEVLTRAWKNIWKHKVLWVFGILASCARRGGGGSGGGNSNYSSGSGGENPFSGGQAEQFMNQVGQYLEDNLWIIIAAVLAILLLSLISYSLGMIGRIGMIKGTSLAEKGAESIAFGEVWSESLPYFWRIFGLNFLVGLAFFVIFIPFILLGVIAAGVIGPLTAGVGFFACLIPILCLLVPISWAVSLIVEQAQPAIVLEDLGMLDGFKRGWQIVRSNVVPMIIMALILGIGGAIVGVIVAMPLVIAFVPIIVGMDSLRESLTPLYIALACCLAYMPVLIFFNGILTAYIQSAWALTYMKLAQPREDAPIIIEANA
jgi:hypothetical protein